ncbi:CUBN [Mytilus coruscus]|uniref:CUBN n=1 Tax=Mytilus coruscus TaxID=42192 RepID=A0A6J7ZZ97_MYTCO|nr:CUBN [Mytilus coruscus]
MTPMYSVTTNCGTVVTNLSTIQPRDGSQIFELIVEHSVLDPYIDILPNITYRVILRTTIPGIKVSGFLLEIKENETSSTSLSDIGTLMKDSNMTVVDDQTAMFLSKNSSRQETVCDMYLESSVMWTPRNLKRCHSLSAVLITNESIFYTVSVNVCRASGKRNYFLADIRGDIESPGFPQLYPDNYNATYIIFSIHKLIHLQFQSFNLESSYRGMCFDAVSVISDKTDILCGAFQTEELEKLYFVSVTGKLAVTFSTDNKIGHSGFRFIYFTVEKHECNKTLTLTNDNITSIAYPKLYFPWMYCVISIRLPSEFRIQLTIKDMDIPMKTNGECLNDSLQIISGDSSDTLCGNSSEYSSGQLFYQSSLSAVDIIFTSDYLHEGRGFWIEYSSHVPCSNKTFVNTSGNVYSDNYPNKYSNNQDCFYSIQLSETNGLLELVFESFYTEAVNDAFLRGDLCNLDYLEIYIDDKVERICGQWKGQEHTLSFRTETNRIMLRFVTNDRVTRSGFFATWQNILQNITSPQCSSTWIEREEYSFEIVRNPLTWEESQNDCQT